MSIFLPSAPWTQNADHIHLAKVLGEDNMRWVGGAVRDTLLGIAVNDIDAATTHHPQDIMRLCRDAGLRTVPTGVEHGTVTVLLPSAKVEVTTLREDVSTDGRRATVAFAEDWRDDAARRDFTINALYAHPLTLEISDYFGGVPDLEARLVRFIGDARARIREDHLRILRYFRFQARFGAPLDDEAEAACAELAATLKGLSRERVAMELLHLLSLPAPHSTLARMAHLGVLSVILPECGPHELEGLNALCAAEKGQNFAPDPLRRLAALLPANAAAAEAVALRLRLSRNQRARLICAAGRRQSDANNPLALAYYHGQTEAIDRLLLGGFSTEMVRDWARPAFPLSGGTLVSRGLAQGPDVARLLKMTEKQWVEEGFPASSRVEEILSELTR